VSKDQCHLCPCLFVHVEWLLIFDADGNSGGDMKFWIGIWLSRPRSMVIIIEHFWLMEGAHLNLVFHGVGSFSFIYISCNFQISCNSLPPWRPLHQHLSQIMTNNDKKYA
jgi:hypothetical protein